MKILIKNIQSFSDSYLLTNEKPDFMDNVRWEKFLSLKMEADKKRSLASGYLQNRMCKELGIMNPKYGYSEKGKPYLKGHENIAFNISHSGDYAVLVYCDADLVPEKNGAAEVLKDCILSQAVGIDIQQICFMREGMKKRILNENEQLLPGLSVEEETAFLNRIWSIKESYVKMTGDGLALDFRKIYIDYEKGIVSAKDCETGYFREYSGLDGYVLSICKAKSFTEDIAECVQIIG